MFNRLWNSNATGFFILGFLCILLLSAFICSGSSLYRSQLTVFFRNFEPSCTVGSGPTTITVQGWSANDDCAKMVGAQPNFTGVNWGLLVQPMSGPNTNGMVICEYDIAGRHVTVRDSYGGSSGFFCFRLNEQQGQP